MVKDISDPFNLERFKQAQDPMYHKVVAELENGFKQTHWIWFIFPQIDGLAQSLTAKKYAIKSKDEAIAYLDDRLLAGRLEQCCGLLLNITSSNAREILGHPDDLKLCSSMTLFASISNNDSTYHKVLQQLYNSEMDALTMRQLKEFV